MAKTNTLGIRVTPDLNGELAYLKEAFDFGSFGEMLESLVRFLGSIDEGVSKINIHPREWELEDVARYLPFGDGNVAGYEAGELVDLLWRRPSLTLQEPGS